MTTVNVRIEVVMYEICPECANDKGVNVDVYDGGISVACAYCGCLLEHEAQLSLPFSNTGVTSNHHDIGDH